ncbi:hypothetical protein EXN66_Car013338 [Channa argus]|uniref:Uncharacterized protein n=1 Tax=Channa argus TaxID=215402 RepID=A0A6G1Q5X1_CHAAH|nr:hypothetical protein EXN66_Car013338 [Channa argus]
MSSSWPNISPLEISPEFSRVSSCYITSLISVLIVCPFSFFLLTFLLKPPPDTQKHSLTPPANTVTSLGSNGGRQPQPFNESTYQNVTVYPWRPD